MTYFYTIVNLWSKENGRSIQPVLMLKSSIYLQLFSPVVFKRSGETTAVILFY